MESMSSEDGGVGGQQVPFYALHLGKIFTPMKDAILTYLQSFGLSLDDALNVSVHRANFIGGVCCWYFEHL